MATKTKTKKEKNFKVLSSGNLIFLKMDEVEKGKQIEGELVEIREIPKRGKFAASQGVVIETENEERIGMPSHATINNRLIPEDEPKKYVGSYVRLTYEGQTEPAKKNRHGVHLWKVEVAE